MAALFALGLGCGSEPTAQSCPPTQPPASFGRTCSVDGECDGYLACVEGSCGYPAAMTGEGGADTSTIAFRVDDREAGRVRVEVADGDLERARGLSGRPCMQDGWGMLFVHPEARELSYTVEEMRIAIDLVFVDANGVVVRVFEDVQPGDKRLYRSGEPAKYGVEVAAGVVDAMGVGTADEVRLDP